MLSKRTALMKPSAILMLAAKAGEMKASGQDVISLTVGEPDWDTYPNIKQAAHRAIDQGMTKYTPSSGILDLRKAIAKQISEDLNLSYEAADITVGSGAKFVLYSALQSVCGPGDEVIIPAPYWASYTTMVELAEAYPRIAVCDRKSDFKMTPEILKSSISSKSKAILLNSPSNPTGKVYSRDELSSIANILRENPKIVIISDDIYNRLIFSNERTAPHILHVAPDLRDRTIVLNGTSKSYSMTGWRIGWAAGPRPVISAMTNFASQSISCPTSIAQMAAVEAVNNSENEIKETLKVLLERRNVICQELEKISGIKVFVPDGAFYIWMDVSTFLNKKLNDQVLRTSTDLAQALLEKKLVAVVPGIEFGLEGHFRLSYALDSAKAKIAITRMKEFFADLK